MIDHRRALTLAATAIDFPLDARDRGLLDAHVRTCAACRSVLAGLRRDAARLAALPPIAPPFWVRERIGRPRRSNPFVLLAAAALLVAGTGLAAVIGGGILRDRTAILVPPQLPSPTVAAPVNTAPASFAPTAAPAGIPSGHILVRRIDPAGSEPAPVSWGLVGVGDGSYLSLGVAVDAALSADGSRVHLVVEDARCIPTLVTVDLEGREIDRVTGNFTAGDGPFAWSPDDAHVVFGRYVNGQPAGMCRSQGGVYTDAQLVSATFVMDRATEWGFGAPLVAESAPAHYGWSPDGRSISLTDASPRLSVVDSTSGSVTDLSDAVAAIGARDIWEAHWAPDGRSIAFVYSGDPSNVVGVVTIADRAARSIGSYGDVTNVLAWAPDGGSIAAMSIKDGYLVLLRPNGLNNEMVLGQTEVEMLSPFGWSPDGRWLACSLPAGEVGLVSANGLEVMPIFVPPVGVVVNVVGWSAG